jgi:hypothetical protein
VEGLICGWLWGGMGDCIWHYLVNYRFLYCSSECSPLQRLKSRQVTAWHAWCRGSHIRAPKRPRFTIVRRGFIISQSCGGHSKFNINEYTIPITAGLNISPRDTLISAATTRQIPLLGGKWVPVPTDFSSSPRKRALQTPVDPQPPWWQIRLIRSRIE